MGPNREQLVRPQVWRTSLGVDMESEKKRQPGQSPGEHQLMRTAADKGPAKETEGAAREVGGKTSPRSEMCCQSLSGALYFSSLVIHSFYPRKPLPTSTPSQLLLLPAKFPFILQVSA